LAQTATSDKTDNKQTSSSSDKNEDNVPEVKAEDVEKLNEDPSFELPVAKIRTAEDAYMAYLHGRIDEGQLRAAVSVFGKSPLHALKNRLERPDNAFERTIPEDLFDDPSIKISSVEDRMKEVDEKHKRQDEATEAFKKDLEKKQAGLHPTMPGQIPIPGSANDPNNVGAGASNKTTADSKTQASDVSSSNASTGSDTSKSSKSS
jgi:hypothetical protein